MLLFSSIALGALVIVYFYVVPQLESNLKSQKVEELKRDVTTYSKPFKQAIGREVSARELDSITSTLAPLTGARVTLLGIPTDEDPGSATQSPPYVISDSSDVMDELQPSSKNVLSAARTGRVTTTTKSEGGRQLAQAAEPILYRGNPAWVVVFSEPLDDVAKNVGLIRRQFLIAGVLALAVAVLSGFYASRALARRVKRLEQAAEQVAAGNFSEPIPVDSEDELGQLAQAFSEMQQRLGRLDEARKEFIANASHELRTPIFSLGGFVELLQDEDLDEETRAEFLATMREQLDRLRRLATDLLDLSRLDAGSLELERERVPLHLLADRVAGEFAAAASRNRSDIQVTREDSETVEAVCDAERVAQILRILISNALTHTGEGTSIVVEAGPADDGEETAELTVTDDGPGIDRENAPLVFDRFHTGNTAHGSGLGLAIARELAEHMLGKLGVESRPGRTVFTLTLPLAEMDSPENTDHLTDPDVSDTTPAARA